MNGIVQIAGVEWLVRMLCNVFRSISASMSKADKCRQTITPKHIILALSPPHARSFKTSSISLVRIA